MTTPSRSKIYAHFAKQKHVEKSNKTYECLAVINTTLLSLEEVTLLCEKKGLTCQVEDNFYHLYRKY